MTAAPGTRLAGVERALVIGLGASGGAAVEALVAAGVEVVAIDEQPEAAASAAAHEAGARVCLGVDDPTRYLEDVDLVVPSPGVVEHAPVLAAAGAAGLPVWSEPELGWRLHPRRLVGVTGTNGKTSVTELIAEMLTVAGHDALACGNIGLPLTAAAAQAPADTTLVAELSSFQLRFCHRLRPEIAVLTNIAPDHLDWHRDAAAYRAAKARLWQAQGVHDWIVVGDDDPARQLVRAGAPGRVAWASGTRPPERVGAGVVDGRLTVVLSDGEPRPLLSVDELWPPAPHHHGNVAAAATAAMLLGADADAVAQAARRFRPGPHRLEIVGERGGVTFVDDSKATNPHAAAAALTSFDSVVWIAGGLAKGVDLRRLGDCLAPVRAALLLGEAAPALARVCADHDVPAETVSTMREAVERAIASARPGDTVLLSPACASFDMFRDYAHRGEAFVAAVGDVEAGDG